MSIAIYLLPVSAFMMCCRVKLTFSFNKRHDFEIYFKMHYFATTIAMSESASDHGSTVHGKV